MLEPIENTYFNWLYSKVASAENPTPSITYYKLLGCLHSTEFVWFIVGDDNRLEDGLDLRREFLLQSGLDSDPYWMNLGCSVLEMLIAFARTAEFTTEVSVRDWFWIFMTNLGLYDLNDAERFIEETVADTMDRFIWRTYEADGRGGLFPLQYARLDQRKVEIWYQFNYYLADQEL